MVLKDEAASAVARRVFEAAVAKEFHLFAGRRVECASRGEIGWTLEEVCERLRRCAYEMEIDPEVRKWIDELIDQHWEQMFYLTTLYVTDPT